MKEFTYLNLHVKRDFNFPDTLGYFQNLKEIQISGYYTKVGSLFLENKNSLVSIKLTKLMNSKNSHEPEDSNYLEDCENLTDFTIDETFISRSINQFKGLILQITKLKIIPTSSLSNEMIHSILKCTSYLTDLDLTDCKSFQGSIIFQEFTPYLSRVNISGCLRVNNHSLSLLQPLHLESLNLSFPDQEDINFIKFSNINAKKLYMNNRSFHSKDDFLKEIVQVKNLEFLEMKGKVGFDFTKNIIHVLGVKIKTLKFIHCSLGNYERNEKGLFKEISN